MKKGKQKAPKRAHEVDVEALKALRALAANEKLRMAPTENVNHFYRAGPTIGQGGFAVVTTGVHKVCLPTKRQ